jgi:hypothetical protein
MNMMLLPLHKAGSNCCTRKNGARTVHSEEVRIRERDESAVVVCGAAPDAVTTDGVPEDLMS